MQPVVLGIDTSGSWCSAAVSTGAQVFSRRADVGHAHSDHLLSMVEAVLADSGRALGSCDVVAFGAGPGSFTGLRVACAAAQGLAYGASLPVAAIGTLEAIAHAGLASVPTAGSVLAVQDARMGEVYWALFGRVGGRLEAFAGPALTTPLQLPDAVRASEVRLPLDLGCGNAWTIHADLPATLVGRVVPVDSADAVDVAALGADAFRAGRLVPADQARPIYVRNDVARTTAEREASRHAVTAAG